MGAIFFFFLNGKINVISDFQKQESSPSPPPRAGGCVGPSGTVWGCGGGVAVLGLPWGRAGLRVQRWALGCRDASQPPPCSSRVPHSVAAAAVSPLGHPGSPRQAARAAGRCPHPGHQPWFVLAVPAMGSFPLPAGAPPSQPGGSRLPLLLPSGTCPLSRWRMWGTKPLWGGHKVTMPLVLPLPSLVPPGALLSPSALLSGINPLAPNPSCPHPSGQLLFLAPGCFLPFWGGLPRAGRASAPACSPPPRGRSRPCPCPSPPHAARQGGGRGQAGVLEQIRWRWLD